MTLRSLIAAALSRAPVTAVQTGERKSGGGAFGGTLVFSGASERAAWSERSYASLARTGFMRNPVVYRSVRLIAENVAAAPLLLYDGEREVAAHPLLDLLRQPNAAQNRASFIEALCGHFLLGGDAFVEAVFAGERPGALHLLRPDRVSVKEDRDGWAEAYEYRIGGRVRRIAAEGEDGRPGPLLHLRVFHPLDDHCGFAPLAAAQTALDLHNATAEWNKALLDNSARPSGALVYAPGDGGNLSPDQFDRLKAELEARLYRIQPGGAADAARRRARLEGDGALAERDGLR